MAAKMAARVPIGKPLRLLRSNGFASAAAAWAPGFETLLSRATTPEVRDWTIGLRREMHLHPELMYNELKTSALVCKTLDGLGVKNTTGWGVNTRPERYCIATHCFQALLNWTFPNNSMGYPLSQVQRARRDGRGRGDR